MQAWERKVLDTVLIFYNLLVPIIKSNATVTQLDVDGGLNES
jgi:hypothetical protein